MGLIHMHAYVWILWDVTLEISRWNRDKQVSLFLRSFNFLIFFLYSLKWNAVCSVCRHIWMSNLLIKEHILCQVINKTSKEKTHKETSYLILTRPNETVLSFPALTKLHLQGHLSCPHCQIQWPLFSRHLSSCNIWHCSSPPPWNFSW